MLHLQPRSLLLLLLLGYGCLAIPLGLGLHKAAEVVRSLDTDAERLLHHGVDTARRGRALVALASDLARNARQYHVLGDPALAAVYRQRHRRLMAELDHLAGLTDPDLADPVAGLQSLAGALDRHLGEALLGERDMASALPYFEDMVGLARDVETLGTRRFDSALAQLGTSAKQARDALARQALFLIPISVALAALFTTLVVRPVRQLARAIRALGEGRLVTPVAIHGPTEIASLGQEIEWLRARLAADDEQKSGFLRRMSHELKTPLASLREGTNLLADGSVGRLDDRQREVVGIMRECTARLDGQIENLLAWSALDSSRLQPNVQRVRLDGLIAQVLRARRLEIQHERIHVDVRLEPAAVMFDPEQLRMAVDNVIGNAIKFTPAGGTIAIALHAGRDRATVDVRDSGQGIAPEERELVFKPFFQGSAARGVEAPGTGVGLSVVRECMHAHGGSVEVVESGGEGAHLRMVFKGVRRVR